MDTSATWLTRALRIVVVAEWVALGLGLLVVTTSPEISPELALASTVAGAIYVVVTTFTPASIMLRRGFRLEIVVIAGAVLTVAATTLTGGADSSFLLLALTPTLLASVAGGTRMGITTSLLSAGMLIAALLAASGLSALIPNAGAIVLFPLLAFLVAQIRNLLVESEERAASLVEASIQAEAELQRLGQANDLLRRLADVYSDGGANPVEVGRSSLEAIIEAYPGSFATATLFDSQGPVVVARVGTDSPALVRTQFPLGDTDSTSGVVSIGTPHDLTAQDQEDVKRALRPLAVAFANTLLLQDIARTAVREERLRLARELHDEIGPALAALGLSLDLISMHVENEQVDKGVGEVRDGLGGIVEDLRSIIADLREEPAGSLTAHLRSMAAELQPPPDLDVELREQRPPGATAARQISAIVTESVRNAYRHADANLVTVRGDVDRNVVDITIADDGTGFDMRVVPEGHYGLMGMRERADRIGARIEMVSGHDGTTVRLIWKDT